MNVPTVGVGKAAVTAGELQAGGGAVHAQGRTAEARRIKPRDIDALASLYGATSEEREALATRHNVDIQVLPFTAGMHAGLAGSFVILDFPVELDSSVVFTETATDSLFVQDAPSVQRFVTVFANRNSASLRAPHSLKFIRQIMESEHQHDDD